jgi:hypothetical protein
MMEKNEKNYDANETTAICRFFRRYVSTGRSIMVLSSSAALSMRRYTCLKIR